MKRLLIAVIAVLCWSGCAAEVVDTAPEDDVGVTAQTLLECMPAAGSYTTIWSDLPTFTKVTGSVPGGLTIADAVAWLKRRTININLPASSGSRLVAWRDLSINKVVAYLMTDTLWASHAIQPYDQLLGAAMKLSLVNLGRYGNGLHDSLFRNESLNPPKYEMINVTTDLAHGTLLGTCKDSLNVDTEIRTFDYKANATLANSLPTQYIDSAVYRALDEYWNSATRQLGINRLQEVIRNSGTNDTMFWDATRKWFVDVASRPDYNNLADGYENSTFKVGLVLYALKVMGIPPLPNLTQAQAAQMVLDMQNRLREAQWPASGDRDQKGGLAHLVRYNSSGSFQSRKDPTGEATSIGILSYTVNKYP